MRLSPNTMVSMPEFKGEHIRSIAMKNFFVWIVLISNEKGQSIDWPFYCVLGANDGTRTRNTRDHNPVLYRLNV